MACLCLEILMRRACLTMSCCKNTLTTSSLWRYILLKSQKSFTERNMEVFLIKNRYWWWRWWNSREGCAVLRF